MADAEGRQWLLYHSYAAKGFVATGRQMLLDEVVFGADGWPTINQGKGPSVRALAPAMAQTQRDDTRLREEFDGAGSLQAGWHWPIDRRPSATLAGGALTLVVEEGPAAVVRSIPVPSFVAETAVEIRGLSQGAEGGLAVYGDRSNLLTLVTDGKRIQVWSQRRGERTLVAEAPAEVGPTIRLRLAGIDGNRFRFAAQRADGTWTEIAAETDGSFLPPWDRGVRVGLVATGPKGTACTFAYFASTPDDGKLFAR